jgi:hypothetical protein
MKPSPAPAAVAAALDFKKSLLGLATTLLCTFAVASYLFAAESGARAPHSNGQANAAKLTWHTLEFAIMRYNGGTPNSWNIYHSQKKGVLLVRLWKRYLLVRVNDEEVYDIDPEKIKVTGDAVEWSTADIPEQPIETPDWKERNLGPVELIRFRLGKDGHVLELQIPFGPDGKPMY